MSVLALASAFSSSGVSTTPEWKHSAIQLLEDDSDLSDNEHIRAMKLIHHDASVADVLLAIGLKSGGHSTSGVSWKIFNYHFFIL